MCNAKSASQLFDEAASKIKEIMPWDLEELLNSDTQPIILDVRERTEFEGAKIKTALNVPRGILENACDYDYAETEPWLVNARDKSVVVVCRSGNRSASAALTMTFMGYSDVCSLRLGVKGWNDFDLMLEDINGQIVDPEWADAYLNPPIRQDQLNPER